MRSPSLSKVVWGLWITLAVAQVIASVFLFSRSAWRPLRLVAWGVWAISCVLGWLPTFTLRKHGGVAKGKSYIHTTALVDRGIYGLVRHPQYLSFLLVHLFFVLLVQHWAVTALGLAAIPLLYLIVQDEEQRNLERFGEAYRDYMARVPQLNLVAGLCRLLRRRSGG